MFDDTEEKSLRKLAMNQLDEMLEDLGTSVEEIAARASVSD